MNFFFFQRVAFFFSVILVSCLCSCSGLYSEDLEKDGEYLEGELIQGAGDVRSNENSSDEQEDIIKDNSELVRVLRVNGADAKATKRGIVINLPDAYFEFDRYTLTPDAIRTLGEISRILKSISDRSFSIEGHTDYIGRVTQNKDLSLKRASSVASELQRHGVKGREMKIKGYGEGYPIATNNSESGRSRNRRVEIVISLN